MSEPVQTWHYGLMARYWAENNTTGPEIAYYQQQIEKLGQPVLDAGCGTGRLLIPFLRAGLDVDGVDVSGDMLAYCKQTAEREAEEDAFHSSRFGTINSRLPLDASAPTRPEFSICSSSRAARL